VPAASFIKEIMEAVRTSETLLNFYQTKRRNNPEDSQLHSHCRENLKSRRFRVLRDWVLSRVCGTESIEEKASWRKLNNDNSIIFSHLSNIIRMTKYKRMKCTRHTACMVMRNVCKISIWKSEEKIPLRRSSCTWKDNIKIGLKEVGCWLDSSSSG
jgi:hypothetical protein